MKRRDRYLLFMYAAAVAGAAVVYRRARQNRNRLRLLQQGEIRELRSRWFDVNGCRMHVRVADAATCEGTDPVVLVHGLGVAGTYFVPMAERLASRFPVYVPDLPGHGRSATPQVPLGIDGLAQALLDWMDKAGLGRVSLVGQSMGCQVVLAAAARSPDRVHRLVLIGPVADTATRNSAVPYIYRLLATAVHERLSLYFILARDYLRMGWRLLPEARSLLQDRTVARLYRVTTPTLLIRGEKDAVVPTRWFAKAARLLNTPHTLVIPGGGHAVQYSAPVAVATAIVSFLEWTVTDNP